MIRACSAQFVRSPKSTVILAHGGTLWEMQKKMLGHSSPNVTAKVYAHLVPGFMETAVSRLPIGRRPTPEPESAAQAAPHFGQPVVSGAPPGPHLNAGIG